MSNNQNEYNKALQNLLAMSGKKAEIKKVWENASPGSDFVEQTITLNVANASFILVEFKVTKNSNLWKVAILACDGNSYYGRAIQCRVCKRWYNHRNSI